MKRKPPLIKKTLILQVLCLSMAVIGLSAPVHARSFTETVVSSSGNATQTGRLNRNAVVSSCSGTPKVFPGVLNGATSYAVSFMTPGFPTFYDSDACVNVTFNATCTSNTNDIHVAAQYQAGGALAANQWIADAGDSSGTAGSARAFSFKPRLFNDPISNSNALTAAFVTSTTTTSPAAGCTVSGTYTAKLPIRYTEAASQSFSLGAGEYKGWWYINTAPTLPTSAGTGITVTARPASVCSYNNAASKFVYAGAGRCIYSVAYAGTDFYEANSQAEQAFDISPNVTQALTPVTLAASYTVGAPAVTVPQPTLASGLPLAIISNTPGVCTLQSSGGSLFLTFAAPGACQLSYSAPGGRVGSVFYNPLAQTVSTTVNAPCVPTDPNADSDNDGIPNGLESVDGRNVCLKDNDIYSIRSLFVKQSYRDYLSREGDAGSVNYFIGELNSSRLGSDEFIVLLADSPELDADVGTVTRLYSAYLLRTPDYLGLQYWIGRKKTDLNLSQLSLQFVVSPEFTNRYGALNNGQFVDLVYNNILGRAPDVAGRNFWLNRLNTDLSRADMMVNFSESDEYKASRNFATKSVIMYAAMLKRAPTDAEKDAFIARATANSLRATASDLFALPDYRSRFLP